MANTTNFSVLDTFQNYSLNYSGQSTTEITEASSSAERIYRATYWIIKIAFPVLVALGTVGNALVVAVLKRGAIRTDNLRFYLSVLAVVDTVFLYTSCFQTWLRVVCGFELLYLGSWTCQAGLFLNQLSLTLSAWIMVVITWQRWYTCYQPFKRCCPMENSRWRYLGLVALVLALVASNSYVLFTVELVYIPDETRRCLPREEFYGLMKEVFPYVMMALYSVVPASLLFMLNGLLVRVLYQSRRALLSNANASRESGQWGRVRTRYNYVTVVLLALSTLWFVLTVPLTMAKLLETAPESEEEDAVQLLTNVLLYVCVYINHSANFFIYLAMLRRFRTEVKKMFKGLTAHVTSFCRARCSRSDRRAAPPATMNGTRGHHGGSGRKDRTNSSSKPLLVHISRMRQRKGDAEATQMP